MISNWTAKRAGAGITIRGTREGLPVKLVDVASVGLQAFASVGKGGRTQIVATMKDGATHQLAAM